MVGRRWPETSAAKTKVCPPVLRTPMSSKGGMSMSSDSGMSTMSSDGGMSASVLQGWNVRQCPPRVECPPVSSKGGMSSMSSEGGMSSSVLQADVL